VVAVAGSPGKPVVLERRRIETAETCSVIASASGNLFGEAFVRNFTALHPTLEQFRYLRLRTADYPIGGRQMLYVSATMSVSCNLLGGI
jgi:hypothetical protein